MIFTQHFIIYRTIIIHIMCFICMNGIVRMCSIICLPGMPRFISIPDLSPFITRFHSPGFLIQFGGAQSQIIFLIRFDAV